MLMDRQAVEKIDAMGGLALRLKNNLLTGGSPQPKGEKDLKKRAEG